MNKASLSFERLQAKEDLRPGRLCKGVSLCGQVPTSNRPICQHKQGKVEKCNAKQEGEEDAG